MNDCIVIQNGGCRLGHPGWYEGGGRECSFYTHPSTSTQAKTRYLNETGIRNTLHRTFSSTSQQTEIIHGCLREPS